MIGAAVAVIIAIAMFLNKSKTFYRLTLALATLVSAYSAYKIVEKLSIYATIGISWRAIISDVWDIMPCFFGSVLFLGVAAIYATSAAAKKAFKSQKQSLFALVFSVLAALNTGGIWFAEKMTEKILYAQPFDRAIRQKFFLAVAIMAISLIANIIIWAAHLKSKNKSTKKTLCIAGLITSIISIIAVAMIRPSYEPTILYSMSFFYQGVIIACASTYLMNAKK